MRYRFEEFELDAARRTLRRAGTPLKVQPKVLDLLIFLVRHQQRATSKEELLRAIWPDSSVGDAALRRLLKEARHAIGDDGAQQRLIATARSYGYRLAVPVEVVGHGGDEHAYIGRESALARIESSLESAVTGQGRILLLAGEPGIGKTRLAEEAAELGRLEGAEVLGAWASEGDGAPAYWPWLQVLRDLSESRDAKELRSALGGVGPELAEVAPWLRDRIPDLSRLTSLQPDAARFRLFDAFQSLIERVTARRMLVIILDDLHWADAQSLQLLDFLAHSVGHLRLLIVASYRQEEMEREPTRWEALGRLGSHASVASLPLAGFSREEVSRFIAVRTGSEPRVQVAEALHAKTEGNPLLLGEILRSVARDQLADLIDTKAWSDAQPRGVEQVMDQRLQLLSEATRRVLRAASAIGREFDAALLGSVVAGGVDDFASALEEAMRTRVVVETRAGAYRFSHMLVRDALYTELGEWERAELHRAIGRTLEADRGDESENIHALAHQFFAAYSSGDADKAILYSERAGDLAAGVYASEQAARHYGHAVDILQLQRRAAAPRHLCSLLLKLGEAQRYNGDRAGANQTCGLAAEIARTQGWPRELARAALGMSWWTLLMSPPDFKVAGCLEEAITTLGEDDLALRAELLARLAAEYCLDSDVERCRTIRQQALDAALASGSGLALAGVFSQPYSGIWETTVSKATRLSLVKEAAQRCREAGELGGALQLDELAAEDYLARGQLDLFDAELDRLEDGAARFGDPWLIARLRIRHSARAMLAGRFEEAESLSQQGLELGQRVDVAGPRQVWVAQLIILRSEQGRLAELLPALEGMDHVGEGSLTVECFTAWVYTDVGDPRARGVLDRIMVGGLPALSDYHSGIAQASVLAHVCAELGAAEYAPRLYEFLEPLRGSLIVHGTLACHGPAAYFLGLLASLQGLTAHARELYEEALEFCERIGAKPVEARIRQALARLLLAEGDAALRPRALALVRRSLTIAEALDMRGLVAAGRLLEQEARGAIPLRRPA